MSYVADDGAWAQRVQRERLYQSREVSRLINGPLNEEGLDSGYSPIKV